MPSKIRQTLRQLFSQQFKSKRRHQQRAYLLRPLTERLEERCVLATITNGAGPGGFEQTGVTSSLAFWVDASDIDGNGAPDALANDSAITTWKDKSGFARDLTNQNTVFYTLASAAGNNVPSTRYTNSRMLSAFNFDALSSDYSIFGVSRYTGGDNERIISSETRNWLFGHHGALDERFYAEGWIHGPGGAGTGTASTAFNVYSGLIGPTVNGNAADPGADFWKNGVQLTDNNVGSNNTAYKPGRLSIGSGAGLGETGNAEVSEIVIINRNLNEAERRIIENALSAKYNVAINAAQDMYAGDNAGSDYDQNVFGIGRVLLAHQLLSAGQSGFGIEASAIENDGDFVMAGHKQLTNGKVPVTGVAGVTERWSRTWNVDVTDANDNLGATLSFDYSDAGLAIGANHTFRLLRSSDGVTFTPVAATPTRNGDTISFMVTAAQLADGIYTLGDSATIPVLTASAGNAAYSIGGAAVAVDPGLSIFDADSASQESASVSVSGFVNGQADVLAFVNQNGITGSYNNTTGVLSLTTTPSLDYSFNANNGSFSVVNDPNVEDPWQYSSVRGTWFTNGTRDANAVPQFANPAYSELNSSTFTVRSSGAVSLSFNHRYSFEYDGTRWDGGQVRISVNGGAFTAVPAAAFSANGYVGQIQGNGILNGQDAFNGDSAGFAGGTFITSTASLGTSFAAGDRIRIQFLGSWDEGFEGSLPNWEIDSVSVTNARASNENMQAALRSVTYSAATSPGGTFRTINFASTDPNGNTGVASRAVGFLTNVGAQNVIWDNTSGNFQWTTPSNWVGDVLPDADDIAVFQNVGIGTVTLGGGTIQVGGVSFENTAGSYSLVSGTLQLGSIAQSGSAGNNVGAAINLLAPLSLNVTGSAPLTVSGAIGGAGDVNKIGAGTLVLSGANTYSGGTNINQGALRLSNGANVPTVPAGYAGYYSFDNVSGATVNNAGAAGASKNGTLVAGSVISTNGYLGSAMNVPTSAGGARMEILASGIDLAGTWTAGVWFKDLYPIGDWRTLLRGASNDHQIIIENSSNNLGAYDNASGGFRDSGYDLVAATVTGWHHIAAVGSGTTTVFYIDGAFVGTSDRNSLTEIFSIGAYQGGSQRFSQFLDELYIYQTALSAGQVADLYNNGALSLNSTVNVIPDGSTVTVAGTLDLNGVTETVGALAGGGTVTSTNTGVSHLRTGASNASATFSGSIQDGAGVTSLTKVGSGTQQLTGASTYGGATTIIGGTLQLGGGDNRLPVTTQLVLGGVLDLNNSNQTLANITATNAAARVVNSAAVSTNPDLTLNIISGATTTFTGILGNTAQNAFDLVKTGAGTLVLPSTNTYIGSTTINGGVLSISSDANLGTAPGAATPGSLALANGATLIFTAGFTLSANRGLALNSGGGQFNVTGGVTYNGLIAGGGGLTKTGAGDLILNGGGANNPGTMNINAGRVFFNSQNALGTGTVNINNGGTLDYQGGTALVLPNVMSIASGGNIASRAAQLTSAATLPTAGTLIINQDDQNTNTVVLTGNIALTGALTIQVGGGGGNGGVARLDGLISNNQIITKQQTGILHLNNSGNTFGSDLNILSGTLRVSQNGVLGSTTGVTFINSGTTLQFDGGVNYTTPEVINVAGGHNSGIIANLSGSNSFSGTIQGAGLGGSFSGGDVGEGLDLDGAFLYAVNARGPSVPQIRSATFTDQASQPNVVITAAAEILAWQTPAFGATANDDNLEIVMQSIRHGGANPGNINVLLNGLTPGQSYKLQLLIYENNTNRRFEVFFDGHLLAHDYTGGVAVNVGGVFTYEFVATATQHTVRLDGATTTANFDKNPVLQGLTLEQTPFQGVSGPVNLRTDAGSLTLAGQIAANVGGVVKSGTGSLTLAANNLYSGNTIINAGTLIVENANALGTATDGTTVNAGATLALRNNLTLPVGETLTLNGTGATGQLGALVNLSGNNSVPGNILLGGAEARIGSVDDGGTAFVDTLTLGGNINLFYADLSFDGSGAVQLNGQILVDTSLAAAPALFGVTAELELWLDASDINANGTAVADGTVITNWQDKSGKDRDFNGLLGDPNYVLASTNGRPAIDFDGNDALQMSALHNPRTFIDGNGEFTIISVARYSGATQGRVISARSGHNWLFGFHGGSTNRNGHYDAWGSLDPAPVGFVSDTNWHLHANQMNVYSEPTNPAGDWWRDGVRITDDSRGTADSFANNVPDGLEVGAWNGLGEPSTAQVSELMLFNRALSNNELQIVQRYLNTKYSLGFASTPTATNGLRKLGAGTLTLAGNNSYPGATTINGGTLVAANSSALGGTAVGTTVASGATLALQRDLANNPITVGESITALGTGVGGNGAIRNLQGNNAIVGPIAMPPAAFSTAANVPLQAPTATFSQTSWPVSFVLDGILTGSNGWADDSAGTTNAQTAVFETQSDLGIAGTTTELTFTLAHTSSVALHNLGRVRLSYTTDPRSDFADGLINNGDVTANWTVLTPASAVSTLGAAGATLTILADGSVLASGVNPNTDTYVIKTQTTAAQITGFRLEVMLDASLPTSGPGRASNGNFVLSEFQVQSASAPLPNTTLAIVSDADTLALTNTITTTTSTTTLAFGGAGNTNVTGAITQPTGTTSVVKDGAGTLTLANPNNNYSGTTTINAGILSVSDVANNGSPSGLGTGSVVNINGNSVLQFNAGTDATNRTINLGGTSGANSPRIEVLNGDLQLAGATINGAGQNLGKLGAGTLTLDTGTSVTLGNLYVAGGNLTLRNNSTTNVSGVTAIGANSFFINNGTSLAGAGTLNVQNTALLNTSTMNVGENNGGAAQTNTINQSGGTVNVSNNSSENAAIRLGHWPNTTNTYNLSGGALNITQADMDIAIGTDGTGIFNQSGGTATSPGVMVNHRNAGGSGTLTLTGGTFNLGTRGFQTAGGTANLNLGGSGATLRATGSFASSVPAVLSGTGASAINIDTNGQTVTWNANLTGAGGINKIGAGTLLLNGAASTYAGATAVDAGTLGGSGNITSAVNLANVATLSPGGTPGALGVGTTTFVAGSIFRVELNGPAAGTGYDQLRVIGSVNLANATLNATTTVTPALGQIYRIIDNDGSDATNGTFAGLVEGSIVTIGGLRYYITYNDPTGRFGTGNDVALVRNNTVTAGTDNFPAINEDTPLAANVKTNDTDLDRDGTVQIVSGPTSGSFTSFDFATGAFTYQPTANFSGTDSFTYRLFDGEFTSSTVTATITITPVADQPNLTVPAAVVTGLENTPIPLPITASLVDTDGSETLSIVISNVPSLVTLSAGTPSSSDSTLANRSYTLTPAQLVGLTLRRPENLATFTLQVDATARETVTGALSAPRSAGFAVRIDNAAPTPHLDSVLLAGAPLATIPNTITAAPGSSVSFVVSATDLAPDPFDAPFTFTLTWGNGTITQVQTTPGLVAQNVPLTFTYDFAGLPTGLYQPTLSVVDNDGSPAGTLLLPAIQLATAVTVEGVLYVGGTAGSDRIILQTGTGGISVRINNLLVGNFSASRKIVVYGNDGSDTITSSALLPVEIYGGAGDDYLTGGNSADTLDGGDGRDRLLGGNGNDMLLGGPGDDTLTGGSGNDYLSGDEQLDPLGDIIDTAAEGRDTLSGDAGNDTLLGGAGMDTLNGGVGNDYLRGDAGGDKLDGGDGHDLLLGGAGGDTLYGRAGRDILIGGDGLDNLLGSTSADLLSAGDLDAAFAADDTQLLTLWQLWSTSQAQSAFDLLAANSVDDHLGDTLHGEADVDWYLLFALDYISATAELKGNKIFTL